MSFPVRIDGIGTRRNDSGVEVANIGGRRQKFVRMYASEAIAKGSVVAFNFHDTEPANGWGNHVLKAFSGDAMNIHAIGIAAETIADGDLGLIQVYGYCDYAIASADTLADDGQHGMLVGIQNAEGELELYDTSAAPAAGGDTLALGILIDFGTDATADSTVWLLNPANL